MPDICRTCLDPRENHRPDGRAPLEIERLGFKMDCRCNDPRFVAITQLYPTAVFDGDGRFQGRRDTPCEHRTVGSHRAWCFEDTEWCYLARRVRGMRRRPVSSSTRAAPRPGRDITVGAALEAAQAGRRVGAGRGQVVSSSSHICASSRPAVTVATFCWR